MDELHYGQRIDPENGLIECWFTHSSLDEMKSMDLTDKNILMYGAGMGDAWLARRCKKLVVVEREQEWLIKASEICSMNAVSNVEYLYRPCRDSFGKDEYYLEFPEGFEPDIIISDDAYRTEAVRMAIDYFQKKGGGILVCDNYWQDFVWKSPIVTEWVEPFEKHIHSQPDHTNYEEQGCEWKTAIIFIK